MDNTSYIYAGSQHNVMLTEIEMGNHYDTAMNMGAMMWLSSRIVWNKCVLFSSISRFVVFPARLFTPPYIGQRIVWNKCVLFNTISRFVVFPARLFTPPYIGFPDGQFNRRDLLGQSKVPVPDMCCFPQKIRKAIGGRFSGRDLLGQLKVRLALQKI